MSYQQFRPSGFNLLPPVVKNLLIINVLFFLATIVLGSKFGIDLIDMLGLHFPGSEKFEPYQIITYMFMHGGFSHIFFNMFAVWMFGNVLENYWGGKRFLIYYLLTGIGAAFTHYIIVYYYDLYPTLNFINDYIANPDLEKLNLFINSENFKIMTYEMQQNFKTFINAYNSLLKMGEDSSAAALSVKYMIQYKNDFLNVPNVVGASGSLFGVLLAFGMLFPNTLLYIYFAIPIKAKYFVILYGAIELFSGFADKSSNVAHFAHLGGMLFGFILIKFWGTNRNRFY